MAFFGSYVRFLGCNYFIIFYHFWTHWVTQKVHLWEGNVHCFKHPKGNEGTKKSNPPFFHKKLVVNRNCNTYPVAVFMVRPFCWKVLQKLPRGTAQHQPTDYHRFHRTIPGPRRCGVGSEERPPKSWNWLFSKIHAVFGCIFFCFFGEKKWLS